MTVVYRGFAHAISAANREIVSSDMVAIPNGRAYRMRGTHGKVAVYTGAIHVRALAEWDTALLRAQKVLASDHNFRGSLYAGFGGCINFGFAGLTRAPAAVLADINPAQTIFNRDLITAFRNRTLKDFCKDLTEIERSMRSRLRAVFANVQTPLLDDVREDVFRSMPNIAGWILRHDKTETPDTIGFHQAYDHLHDLAVNDAMGALTIDVLDTDATKSLRHHLQTADFQAIDTLTGEILGAEAVTSRDVGILYISNIFNFFSGRSDFTLRSVADATASRAKANLSMLLRSGAAIVHSNPVHNRLTWPGA